MRRTVRQMGKRVAWKRPGSTQVVLETYLTEADALRRAESLRSPQDLLTGPCGEHTTDYRERWPWKEVRK
jgi:hypothetical protein